MSAPRLPQDARADYKRPMSHLLCLLAAATGLAAWAGTGIALRWLTARAILDQPNERSLHVTPTPRGGGLGLMAALLPAAAVLALATGQPAETWAVLAGAAVLAAVSFRDDVRSLGAALRFGVQAVVVTAILAVMPAERTAFGGLLPLWADRLVAGIAWLWFINLFNFMDGIDGISGVQTVAIGVGLVLVALLAGAPELAGWGAILAAAAVGFLVWNWHPARIFLGDAGSIPLGFLMGWLLLRLAGQGLLAAALILPAYYLADASLTLARRLLRGESIWKAHRQHFYQRAIARGWRHDRVALLIGGANVLLVGCALLSVETAPLAALVLAAGIVGLLLRQLACSRPAT